MKSVYLAGPITGCTYQGCTDWRKKAIERLKEFDIEGLDPMRAKSYLEAFVEMGNEYNHPLSSARGIMTRDHWDCTRCDIVLVNFIGAKTVSIGTVMEVAWAWDNQIPVVMAIEESGNPHHHAMINEATGFRVQTLEEAIETVIAILKS
jgi:nucleoside 2-deoxyribosyltransferase